MATPKKRPFELVGADGGPLRGDVRTSGDGESRPAVVICHGFKGFKDWGFFPHVAERLARAGMTAVAFNFSGSGVGPDGESFSEPERFGHMTVSNDLRDIETVCTLLRDGELLEGLAPPTKVALLGHSKGGGTAVLHAAGHSELSAIVTWGAIASVMRWDEPTIERWRAEGKMDVVNTRTGEVLPLYTDYLDDWEAHREKLDIVRAAQRVTAPWLIIHGDADESVSPADAEALYQAAPGEMVELKMIRGGSHTFSVGHPWAGSTRALEEVMGATVEWLVRYLF